MYGDSTKDYIVAFIVPDPEQLASFCKNKQIDVKGAYENEELRNAIYSDLMTLADHFKLNGLEKPRQMILLKEGFTVENGCLTPTFKMMRKRAQDLYKAEI